MLLFFLEWSINKYLTAVTLTHNVALKTQIIYLGYSLRQTDRHFTLFLATRDLPFVEFVEFIELRLTSAQLSANTLGC